MQGRKWGDRGWRCLRREAFSPPCRGSVRDVRSSGGQVAFPSSDELPGPGLPRVWLPAAHPAPGFPYCASESPIRRPVSPVSPPDSLSGARFPLFCLRIVYPAPHFPYFAPRSSIRRSDCLFFPRTPLSGRPTAYFRPRSPYSGAGYPIFSRISLYLPQRSLSGRGAVYTRNRAPGSRSEPRSGMRVWAPRAHACRRRTGRFLG